MKTTIETAAFLKLIPAIKTIITRRNRIPILANIQIDATPETVRIRATDLDSWLDLTIQAFHSDTFTAILPLAELETLVRQAPKGSLLSLSDSGLVQAGNLSKQLEAMPPEDFPEAPKPTFTWSNEVPAPTLANAFRLTMPCTSDEETRYYLRGVYLHSDDGQTRMVSTDGHRLAYHVPYFSYEGGHGVILPKEPIKTLAKLLVKRTEPLAFYTCERYSRVIGSDFILTFKNIDDVFPDYTSVIPKESNEYRATVHLDQILKVKSGVFVFNSDSAATCDGMDIDGPTLEGIDAVGFNPSYLRDIATLFTDKTITLTGQGAADPARVRMDESTFFVIMPKRI